MAVANYRDSHGGSFPPAYTLGPDGRPWHSWRVLILPYIEQQQLHQTYRFDEPWDGPNNRELILRIPKTLAFPDTHGEGNGIANYLAVVGSETLWPGEKPFVGNPKDGTASTILIVENHGQYVVWTEPRDLDFATMSFAVQAPDGISSRYQSPAVGMADGSIRSLSPGVPEAALRAMLTAAGGEEVSDTQNGWTVIEDGRQRGSK